MDVKQNRDMAHEATEMAGRAKSTSACTGKESCEKEARHEKDSMKDKFKEVKERASETIHEKADYVKDKAKDIASKGLSAAADAAGSLADKARNAACNMGK